MGTPKSDGTTTTIIIDKDARDLLRDTEIYLGRTKMSSNSQKITALIDMYKRGEISLK